MSEVFNKEIAHITSEARLELEEALGGAPKRFSPARVLRTVLLCGTLAMLASGFALLVVFVFANLLFHINPGL